MNFISQAFADATTNLSPTPPPQPNMLVSMIPIGMVFLVFYFLMIRPQQKKAKEQELLISGVQKGEEVITQAGIFGKVTEVTDKVVTLEVASNVRIKMLKGQIATVLRGEKA
jgi:preprotein translocase subunit YajC